MGALGPHTQGCAINPVDGARIFYVEFGPSNAERTIVFLIAYQRLYTGLKRNRDRDRGCGTVPPSSDDDKHSEHSLPLLRTRRP